MEKILFMFDVETTPYCLQSENFSGVEDTSAESRRATSRRTDEDEELHKQATRRECKGITPEHPVLSCRKK